MMQLRSSIRFVRTVFSEFSSDGALTLAASIAYYTALSMAPIVLLVLWAAAFLGPGAQSTLVDEITGLIGSQGGATVELVIENASKRPSLGNLAGVFSLLTLAFGASAVFAQLQTAINSIWDVRARPSHGGLRGWLRKRLISVGVLAAALFLLLVSTVVSALLAVAFKLSEHLPGSTLFWSAIHFALSIAVFAAVFALMFRYLPDVKIQWRDVWLGGLSTALLFAAGKFAVGFYLGQSSLGSAYGAAGSLIILLVWAYYSALIFLFGAESTQVWARVHGRGFEPDEHAEPIDEGKAPAIRHASASPTGL